MAVCWQMGRDSERSRRRDHILGEHAVAAPPEDRPTPVAAVHVEDGALCERAPLEGGRFAEVHCDATIAWPLLVRAVLEEKGRGIRG